VLGVVLLLAAVALLVSTVWVSAATRIALVAAGVLLVIAGELAVHGLTLGRGRRGTRGAAVRALTGGRSGSLACTG